MGDNKKKRRKKNTTAKILIVLFSLLILLGSLGYFYLLGFDKSSRAGEGEIKTKKAESGEPVNILVMGVDIGDPKYASKDTPKRTDTMLLVNYNPKNKKINIVSIPRDTRINMGGKKMKINAAHAERGINGAIEAVENLLGISINNYARVDYKGFRKIIDSIGGIDMEITRNMYYDDPGQNLHIHFEKGTVEHLDGEKAEKFFRWRKNNNGTGFADGDLGRIDNQHKFMEKVIEKFKSPAIIPKIPNILSTIPDYVDTDMSPEEIVKYGYIVSKSSSENISMSTLQGEAKYIQGISYFIYDREKNRNLLYTLTTGNSSSNEENSIDKSAVKIQILNGTKINGLASQCAEKLNQQGYTNISTGNNAKLREKSKILSNTDNNSLIREIENKLNISQIEKSTQSDNNFDIIIILGKDFSDRNN